MAEEYETKWIEISVFELNKSFSLEDETINMEPTWTSTPYPKKENRRAGVSKSPAAKKEFHKPNKHIDASLLRRVEVVYGKNTHNSDTEDEQADQRQTKKSKISYIGRENPKENEKNKTLKAHGNSISAENFEIREEKNNFNNKKTHNHTEPAHSTRKSVRINNAITYNNQYMHKQIKRGEKKK
jgi:hypothetical protein